MEAHGNSPKGSRTSRKAEITVTADEARRERDKWLEELRHCQTSTARTVTIRKRPLHISGRNDLLNMASMRLARFVAGGAFDEAETKRNLLDAALASGLGEGEARATLESGWAAGLIEEPVGLSYVEKRTPTTLVPSYSRQPNSWHDKRDPWSLTDSTYDAWCGRTMRGHASRLLAVRDNRDEVTLYVDNGFGIWRRSIGELEALLAATIDDWVLAALRRAVDADRGRIANFYYQGQQRARRERALASAARVLATWSHRGIEPADLTVAHLNTLDSQGRYLGAPNGVIDLDTGELLTGSAARRCLVTRTLPDPYAPGATHPDAERLFAHVPLVERKWLLSAFGYALRGVPSRRIYLLRGETGGGKSTLFKALEAALGEYADAVDQKSLLAPGRFSSNTGPTPENERWTNRRMLFRSEPVTGRLDWVGLKAKSGGDALPFRRLYENYDESHKRYATATLFLAANPETFPAPPLHDEALYERLRVLEYPQVPVEQRDTSLEARFPHDPEARQALAALLVRYAVENPKPPDDVPSVSEAREALLEESLGDSGRWAKSALVPEPDGVVTTAELWRAAIRASGEEDGASRVWGLERKALIALAKRSHNLGNAVQIKVSGHKERGWRGYRLRTR